MFSGPSSLPLNLQQYHNENHIPHILLTSGFRERLYRTVIRPIVTYASETWVLKENIIQKLLVFERNIWAYERKSNMED